MALEEEKKKLNESHSTFNSQDSKKEESSKKYDKHGSLESEKD